MNKQYILTFAVILTMALIVTPSIAGSDTKKNTHHVKINYTNVSANVAKNMLEEKDVFLLDVRIPLEYNYSHIEGATLIPLRSAPKISPVNLSNDTLLPNRMKELPHNKNTKILVYCKQGHRSPDACKLLVDAGYKKVFNMYNDTAQKGGIEEWVNEGNPIVIVYNNTTEWANNYPHYP